jgi:hypothetical protein
MANPSGNRHARYKFMMNLSTRAGKSPECAFFPFFLYGWRFFFAVSKARGEGGLNRQT